MCCIRAVLCHHLMVLPTCCMLVMCSVCHRICRTLFHWLCKRRNATKFIYSIRLFQSEQFQGIIQSEKSILIPRILIEAACWLQLAHLLEVHQAKLTTRSLVTSLLGRTRPVLLVQSWQQCSKQSTQLQLQIPTLPYIAAALLDHYSHWTGTKLAWQHF